MVKVVSVFLFYETCVCVCSGLIPSPFIVHPTLQTDGFYRSVFAISVASAFMWMLYSVVFQCKQ